MHDLERSEPNSQEKRQAAANGDQEKPSPRFGLDGQDSEYDRDPVKRAYRYGGTYIMIGLTDEEWGRYPNAIAAFKTARDIYQSLAGDSKDTPALKAIRKHIERVEPLTVDPSSPEFEKALNAYEVPQKFEERYRLRAMDLLSRAGGSEKAIDRLDHLLKLQERRYGTRSAQVIGTLLDLATTCKSLGQLERAAAYYRRIPAPQHYF